MAIWKEQTAPRKDAAPLVPEAPRKDPDMRTDLPSSFDTPRRASVNDGKESTIAAGLTIEGKIEGAGHIRIAGRFQEFGLDAARTKDGAGLEELRLVDRSIVPRIDR